MQKEGSAEGGEHCPKLNALQASVIFAMRPPRKDDTMEFDASAGPKPTEVGRMFGVSSKVVRDIWNRKTWARATRHLWSPLEIAASVAQETGVGGATPMAKVRKPGRPAGAKDGMPRKKSGYSQVPPLGLLPLVAISEKFRGPGQEGKGCVIAQKLRSCLVLQKPTGKGSSCSSDDESNSKLPKSSMEALVSSASTPAFSGTKADISALLCGGETGYSDCVKALVQLKDAADQAEEPAVEAPHVAARNRRPSLMAAELLSGKVQPLGQPSPAGHVACMMTPRVDLEHLKASSEGWTGVRDKMELEGDAHSGTSTPETCKRTPSDGSASIGFVAPEANALETLMSLMHNESKGGDGPVQVVDLMNRVKQLEAENERLRHKAEKGPKVHLHKVSSKGRIQKPKNKLSPVRDREAVAA